MKLNQQKILDAVVALRDTLKYYTLVEPRIVISLDAESAEALGYIMSTFTTYEKPPANLPEGVVGIVGGVLFTQETK